MDDVLSRNTEDLRDDEKAKRYFQLQNRYLFQRTIKYKLSIKRTRIYDNNGSILYSPNPFNVTPDLKQAAIL